jgi:hypothetical protein
MVLRRIGILSCGKVMGTLYAVMGLILGGIMSLISVIGVAVAQRPNGGEEIGAMFFGVGAVILLPIFYGITGFIGGIIMAAVYNFVAGVVGGVELDLQPTATQY